MSDILKKLQEIEMQKKMLEAEKLQQKLDAPQTNIPFYPGRLNSGPSEDGMFYGAEDEEKSELNDLKRFEQLKKYLSNK